MIYDVTVGAPAHNISSAERICSLLIGGRDLGKVIKRKRTNAGEMLYGPRGG